MARLRHRKALFSLLGRTSNFTGFFFENQLTCKTPSKPYTARARTPFHKSEISLNNKYKEKPPQKSPFLPPFQMPFFDFSPLANSWWFFSNARFRVSHSRNKNRVVALLGFSRLGFLWELVIREERFWNFYGGVVTRRHSLGFFQKRQKWKILIFRFCRYRGFRGEAPNAVIGFFPMVKCALRELVFRVVSEKRVSVHYFTAIQKWKNPKEGFK